MSNLSFKVIEKDLVKGAIIPEVGHLWGRDPISKDYHFITREEISPGEIQSFHDIYSFDGKKLDLKFAWPISEKQYLEIFNEIYNTNIGELK